MECDVIRDLIPLYKEGLLSNASKKLVEEHIKTCESCDKFYKEVGNEIYNNSRQNPPLDFLNKTIKKDRKSQFLMIGSFIASLLIILLSYMTKPIPINYRDNLIKVETDTDNINIEFDSEVTRLNRTESTYEGKNIWFIDGYTTNADKKQNDRYVALKIPKEKVDIIAYTNNGDGLDKILYDPAGVMENGGVASLPRLVLGMYTSLAFIMLVVSVILFLTILKKKDLYKKIRIISVPLSYILASFAIKGKNLSSNYLPRDLIYILVTMVALYLFIYSITLYFERKDKYKI